MSQVGRSLIVGASGQVGRLLAQTISGRDGEHSVLRTSRTPKPGWLTLNLASLTSPEDLIRLLDHTPLSAIYCVGGMTYVDGCEADPDLARRTNALGPELLSRYAAQRGLPFVYYSTEYVFAGRQDSPGPYLESDIPSPLNVYGSSKLEGEQRVLAANALALVLRTTVVYGPDAQAKNFLYTVQRTLEQGRHLEVPEDQISTPTYNMDLVNATNALVGNGASGIFHVTGPELMSRLDFGIQVARSLDLDETLLHGVLTNDLHQPAKRPLAAGLSINKLRSLYPGVVMRPVAEALLACRHEIRRSFDPTY